MSTITRVYDHTFVSPHWREQIQILVSGASGREVEARTWILDMAFYLMVIGELHGRSPFYFLKAMAIIAEEEDEDEDKQEEPLDMEWRWCREEERRGTHALPVYLFPRIGEKIRESSAAVSAQISSAACVANAAACADAAVGAQIASEASPWFTSDLVLNTLTQLNALIDTNPFLQHSHAVLLGSSAALYAERRRVLPKSSQCGHCGRNLTRLTWQDDIPAAALLHVEGARIFSRCTLCGFTRVVSILEEEKEHRGFRRVPHDDPVFTCVECKTCVCSAHYPSLPLP